MILSDVDMNSVRKSGLTLVTPWEDSRLQPASVDLTLSSSFAYQDPMTGEWCKSTHDMVTIQPRQMILGSTMQTVEIPDFLMGRVEGKSTWGRRGLAVHITAGFIDPGFSGQITLEMYNFSVKPLELYAGIDICHISFQALLSRCSAPYGSPKWHSHYQGQYGATLPREGI